MEWLDGLNQISPEMPKNEIDDVVQANLKEVQGAIGSVYETNTSEGGLDKTPFERFFMDFTEYESENPGYNDTINKLLSLMSTHKIIQDFIVNLEDRFGTSVWSDTELECLESGEINGLDFQYFVLKIAFLVSMHLLKEESEKMIIDDSFKNENLVPFKSGSNVFKESSVLNTEISKELLVKYSKYYSKEEDVSFYEMDLDPKYASKYNAHGAMSRVAGAAMKKLLIVLQDSNIDLQKLDTIPLAASVEDMTAFSGLGAVGPFRDSDFIFISAKGEVLAHSGVKIIAVRDGLAGLIGSLQEAFKDVKFVKASDLGRHIESID